MSFKSSLAVGAMGETIFFHAHEGKLERLDGRKADFKCLTTGDLHELKVDTWNMTETPNVFLERYSDRAKKSPGGPSQALANGCRYFNYFFVQNLTVLQFETEPLVAWLNEHGPTLRISTVPNNGWITEGYLVPRERLEGMYTTRKIKVGFE